MANRFERFTNDILLLTITTIILALSALFILPIISKLMGTAQYGIWTQLMITTTIFSNIAPLGLNNAIRSIITPNANSLYSFKILNLYKMIIDSDCKRLVFIEVICESEMG